MDVVNIEQAEHWNSSVDVAHWVDEQTKFDGMLAPFIPLLLEGARIRATDRVLDLGCGCGATTRAAAQRAAAGHAHGVDLSQPMLARAGNLASEGEVGNATFEQADVQVHPFADGAFDAAISRFGVMFFSDPAAAFANVHRALRVDGRLAFVCWQGPQPNEWIRVPRAAITQFVPPPEPPPPGAPGMFAFADPDVVRHHLEGAGWRDVEIDAVTTPLLVGGPGTLDDTVEFLSNGSLGRTLLADADDATRARALDGLRGALEPYVTDEGVRLESAVWLVTACA